jgi:hypothetical protein
MANRTTLLTCACRRSALMVQGAPIINAECLCTDCQNAGAYLQILPGAPRPVIDHNGATRFVLYRKDRVWCAQGSGLLREHRLSSQATTRRVVASCCQTPMFMEMAGAHWLSLYGGLWPPGSLPALEIRTMTRSKPAGVSLPDDVPNPGTHTWSFYIRLFWAWAAMGFRVPRIDFVRRGLYGP